MRIPPSGIWGPKVIRFGGRRDKAFALNSENLVVIFIPQPLGCRGIVFAHGVWICDQVGRQ